MPMKTCGVYGKKLGTNNAKKKYCSPACASKARAEKLALWKENNKDYQSNYYQSHKKES